MIALRTYQITAKQLERLHVFAANYVTLGPCLLCDVDLCEDCQKDADLMALLMDAVSLNAAGVQIILTTQMDGAKKENPEGLVQ